MKLAPAARLIGAGILACALAACTGGRGSNSGITPPGVPNGAARVYVACVSCPPNGQILQYLTPLSSPGTANFQLALNLPPAFPFPLAPAVDPSGSRLFVGTLNGIVVYNLPLTASSIPFFMISISGSWNEQIAFDAAGRLFVPDINNGNVYVFNPPITSASTPAVTHTGYSAPRSITFDAAGNIYVADSNFGKVFIYAPPFTSSSSPTVTLGATNGISAAWSGTVDTFNRLAVADDAPGTGGIRFFTLPTSSASTPSFSVVSGINGPFHVAFDYVGDMFVTNFGSTPRNMTAYSAPLSGASTATATVTAGFGGSYGLGLSFGP